MSKKELSIETTVASPPAGGDVQIGTIVAYYGKTAPDTWLMCDGSRIPDTYGQLRTLLQSDYTPNLCSRIPIGAGTGTDVDGNTLTLTLGGTGGEYKHTLAMNEMPSHQHLGWGEVTSPNPWGTGSTSSTGYKSSGDSDYDNYLYGSTFTGGTPGGQIAMTNTTVTGTSAGATTAHNNVQPYLAINYIIYAGTN